MKRTVRRPTEILVFDVSWVSFSTMLIPFFSGSSSPLLRFRKSRHSRIVALRNSNSGQMIDCAFAMIELDGDDTDDGAALFEDAAAAIAIASWGSRLRNCNAWF